MMLVFYFNESGRHKLIDEVYNLKEIKFELTYKCLLKCIHCSSDANTSACEMTYNDAMNILKQAIEMKVNEISFSGGEPLLWPRFSDFASLCSSAGIHTQVYTSGNIDDLSIFEKIKGSVDTVIFSIYSSDKKCHDQITAIKGSFERTISAIEKAQRVGLNVEFHFVPLKPNYRHLHGIINFAEKLNVSKISILRFVPQGRGENIRELALGKDDNLWLKKTIEYHGGKVQLRTGSPYNFLMINQKPKCNAGIDRLTITPDLFIYPCDAFKQVKAEELVGTSKCSSLDKWSLCDCWNKSPYLNKIRLYHQNSFKEPCNSCSNIESCFSGCIAQKYLAHGKLEKGPDPMCLRMN